MTIKIGSVIQINRYYPVPAWRGCLMIVQKVTVWGIEAVYKAPKDQYKKREDFLTIQNGHFEHIGESLPIEMIGDFDSMLECIIKEGKGKL